MPSAIREHLRGSFAERVSVLEAIADGEVIQRARLPLSAILPHVECPNCGEIGVSAKEPKNVALVQIEALVSATPKDRTKALDVLAKYGLGSAKGITDEEIRERLAATLREIHAALPKEQAEALIARIEPHWT